MDTINNPVMYSHDSTRGRTAGMMASSVLALFIGAALLWALIRFGGPLPLSVTQTVTQKQTTFDASGESEVVTIPDQAEVNVGIQIQKPTIAAAQSEANQIINTISAKLKEAGIEQENIKTTNYNIYPEYDYQSSTRRILGYSVSTNIRVRVTEIDKVNEAIDIATQNGANQVGGVEFILSEEKEAEVLKQAREQAIKDAEANAQELARLAGMRLGKVVNVHETPFNRTQPPMFDAVAMKAEGMGGGNATEIQPGSTKFTYTVTISYETL